MMDNRHLHTFEVSLDVSLRLAMRMHSNVIRVAESGIHNAGDEHLMKSGDPVSALRALVA